MERAGDVAVVRARFQWSDVGSWAGRALWSGGNGGNALRGRVVPIDSRGCLVDSPDRLVAVIGVDDLVVVDTPDAVLVCRKSGAGRPAGGRGAAAARPPAVPLMAETPCRVAPRLPPPSATVPEQRSTMLDRFGVIARILVRLLFRHVACGRPSSVCASSRDKARDLPSCGTARRSTLLVNAVLLREGLPLARFAPSVSTVRSVRSPTC
jgi:hypothetical protein